MNILILNTNNKAGGATKACYRLHMSYLKAGMQSKLLIKDTPPPKIKEAFNFLDFQYKLHREETSTLTKKLRYKMQYSSGNHKDARYEKELQYQERILSQRPPSLEVFTFSNSIYDITAHPLYEWADVIHLHWVAAHFVDYSFFEKTKKPIIWTLHDTNPFTGGCHYSGDCRKFETDCHDCPQLQGTIDSDYSHTELKKKLQGFSAVNKRKIAIVSPSVWLKEESQKSKALGRFSHHVVPYGIDSNIYKLRDRKACKQVLGLPEGKKVILFVAYIVDNIRKGYTLLLNALENINKDEYVVCTVGAVTENTAAFKDIEVHQLGFIEDELLLSMAYNAADMFVIPSLADNLPNTVLESLMCGTPVIAFPVGGIPDMVQHGENGLLCQTVTAVSLADSIMQFKEVEHSFDSRTISENAFKKYNEQAQINAYMAIYKELLDA